MDKIPRFQQIVGIDDVPHGLDLDGRVWLYTREWIKDDEPGQGHLGPYGWFRLEPDSDEHHLVNRELDGALMDYVQREGT